MDPGLDDRRPARLGASDAFGDEESDLLDDPAELGEAIRSSQRALFTSARRLLLTLASSALLLAAGGSGGETVQALSAILGLIVLLPVLIVLWLDLVRAMHDLPGGSGRRRVLLALMGVPQATLGIVTIGIGLAQYVWLLYLMPSRAAPRPVDLLPGWGPSTAFLGMGWYWVRSAFAEHRRQG